MSKITQPPVLVEIILPELTYLLLKCAAVKISIVNANDYQYIKLKFQLFTGNSKKYMKNVSLCHQGSM